MDKTELINLFNKYYPEDITLENLDLSNLGDYVEEFEDELISKFKVVDEFGVEGEDLENNIKIYDNFKNIISEIKSDEVARKDLIINRLEAFLNDRNAFFGCEVEMRENYKKSTKI